MNEMLKWLWVTAVVIVLDLWTKSIASSALEFRHSVDVFPGFKFTLMHNEGAAFSFLNDAGGWQRWFFTVIALGVSGFIVVWLKKLPKDQVWMAVALSLILGGALGNVYDRITLGYVVDFIDVYYGDAHWPAFNIADSAICIGAVMFLIDAFRTHKKGNNQEVSE
jgi:signal peptidase II